MSVYHNSGVDHQKCVERRMRSVAGAVDNSPYQNKLNFRMNIRRKKTTEKQIFNWNSPHKYIFVAMVISFPDETMEISFAIQLTS